MSWSLTIPKQETFTEFENAVWTIEESPKPDRRTKVGRTQAAHVYNAKYALQDLAAEVDALAGAACGHVNPDCSGNISISVTIPAP